MKTPLLCLLVTVALPVSLAGQDLSDINCIVNPEAKANADNAVEFAGGNVYFCCRMCAGKFRENPGKWTAAANYQVAVTGQYEQKACPISGQEITEGQTAEVGALTIGLCCNDCQFKINQAKDLASKVAIVFGADGFEKGFQLALEVDLSGVKCLIMTEADVSEDSFVEFKGGNIYFCCAKCLDRFDPESEAHISLANRQLVRTGQFVQTACPFSGLAVIEDATTKVGELEIGFCNTGCRDKVRDATDELTRTKMVFGDKSFANGFSRAGK